LTRTSGGQPYGRPAVAVAYLTEEHDCGYTARLLVLDAGHWRQHEQLIQPRYIPRTDILHTFAGEPTSADVWRARQAMPAKKGVRHG
jgi:hypothetical protein